jgi:hypothetical protein
MFALSSPYDPRADGSPQISHPGNDGGIAHIGTLTPDGGVQNGAGGGGGTAIAPCRPAHPGTAGYVFLTF